MCNKGVNKMQYSSDLDIGWNHGIFTKLTDFQKPNPKPNAI